MCLRLSLTRSLPLDEVVRSVPNRNALVQVTVRRDSGLEFIDLIQVKSDSLFKLRLLLETFFLEHGEGIFFETTR